MLEVIPTQEPYSAPPLWSQTVSSGCFSSSWLKAGWVTSDGSPGTGGILEPLEKMNLPLQFKRPPINVSHATIRSTSALALVRSLSFSLPPLPLAPSHVYACVHFSQGLRLTQASHIRWMNSTSVLQLCALSHPKEAGETQTAKPGVAHAVC